MECPEVSGPTPRRPGSHARADLTAQRAPQHSRPRPVRLVPPRRPAMTAEPSYLPGASERANEQVRVYEATGGAERWDNRGVPVVILLSLIHISEPTRRT